MINYTLSYKVKVLLFCFFRAIKIRILCYLTQKENVLRMIRLNNELYKVEKKLEEVFGNK